jgi:hypothetical protein
MAFLALTLVTATGGTLIPYWGTQPLSADEWHELTKRVARGFDSPSQPVPMTYPRGGYLFLSHIREDLYWLGTSYTPVADATHQIPCDNISRALDTLRAHLEACRVDSDFSDERRETDWYEIREPLLAEVKGFTSFRGTLFSAEPMSLSIDSVGGTTTPLTDTSFNDVKTYDVTTARARVREDELTEFEKAILASIRWNIDLDTPQRRKQRVKAIQQKADDFRARGVGLEIMRAWHKWFVVDRSHAYIKDLANDINQFQTEFGAWLLERYEKINGIYEPKGQDRPAWSVVNGILYRGQMRIGTPAEAAASYPEEESHYANLG